MLKQLLNRANDTLDALIAQTQEDISNIKVANHAAVNDSVARKNSLIREFETTKKSIDSELIVLAKDGGSAGLGERLDDDTKTALSLMRTKLESLHAVNKEYAKHVVAVKEFFDSMLRQMFKPEDDGVYKARA